LAALQESRELALEAIRVAAVSESVGSDRNRTAKARLASVALSLGDATLSHEMCQLSADPTQRTAFISMFPTWHGDLAKLAVDMDQQILSNDPAFLSALCLAVGSVPSTDQQKDDAAAWKPQWKKWFQTHQNSAVHSAAGWAMRQWEIDDGQVRLPGFPRRP